MAAAFPSRAPAYPGATDELGHPVWDAGHPHYEALDAFTRHLDPAVATPRMR